MSEDKRTARGARTRRGLLEAATLLICERGYSGTGVDAICSRAGVAKTALYWHFGSKAGLLAALVDEIRREWVEAMVEQTAEGTPMERLDDLIAGIRDIVVNRAHLLRVVAVVVDEAALIDDEVLEAMRRLADEALNTIERGFQEALGTPLASGRMLGVTIIAIMHEIRRHIVLYGEDLDLDPYFYDLKRTIIASTQERMSRS